MSFRGKAERLPPLIFKKSLLFLVVSILSGGTGFGGTRSSDLWEIDRYKSLMMTSPDMLTSGTSMNEWSFGAVMGELAKAYYRQESVDERQFDQFARQWLQVIGERRPGITSQVTCVWATGKPDVVSACYTTLLRPELAPFKLLALNYRPDFVTDACDTRGDHGEFRLTFGLTKERPDHQYPYELSGNEMTVIFEYDLAKAAALAAALAAAPNRTGILRPKLPFKNLPWHWARDFAGLSRGGLPGEPAPVDLLREITARVIRYQPQARGSVPVALGQVRINEAVGDPRFDSQQTEFLRQIGVLFEGCYRAMIKDPENPSQAVLACRAYLQDADLSKLPDSFKLVVGKFNNLLTAMASMIESPLPIPVPKQLMAELFNVVGTLSDQIFVIWVMGEIELTEKGFARRPAKDTPEMDYNGSAELKKLMSRYGDQIIDGSIHLNRVLDGAGIKRAMEPEANPLSPWRWSGAPLFGDLERSALVKGRMAQLTCNGCHATQTAIAAAPSLLREVLSQATLLNQIKPTAQILLKAERDHNLHLANLDGFYMISPLSDPGPDGLGHLAPELLRPEGDLDKRLGKMRALIDQGSQRCPL